MQSRVSYICCSTGILHPSPEQLIGIAEQEESDVLHTKTDTSIFRIRPQSRVVANMLSTVQDNLISIWLCVLLLSYMT